MRIFTSVRRIARKLRTALTGTTFSPEGIALPPHVTLGTNVYLGPGTILDDAHGHPQCQRDADLARMRISARGGLRSVLLKC